MIEKHTRRYQKGMSFVMHVARNTLVFKPRRVRERCKTPRIVQLSSMFAHLEPSGDGKSLATKRLPNRPHAQTAYQNSTATRTFCSCLSEAGAPNATAVTDDGYNIASSRRRLLFDHVPNGVPAGDHRQHVLLIGHFHVEHVGTRVVDHLFQRRNEVGLF